VTWSVENESLWIGLEVSTLTMPFSMRTANRSSGRGAGGFSTLPRMSKAEAWQGQMKRRWSATHGTVQPRWVHLRWSASNPPVVEAHQMEAAVTERRDRARLETLDRAGNENGILAESSGGLARAQEAQGDPDGLEEGDDAEGH
jgi:hypothetical protein